MYLSCLLIDTGNNADRVRPGRLWLRNRYRVHQRLCMGFPSRKRTEADPEFLNPYTPEDFPEQRHLADKSAKKGEVAPEVLRQVHEQRTKNSGFLFRIDTLSSNRAVILVQSAVRPDWGYAFHNADFLLAAPPQVRVFDPRFEKGQRLRFRLFANPVRRISRNSLGADGKPVDRKWHGKRVPVPANRLFDWLSRRGETGGFAVDEGVCLVQPGYKYFDKKLAGGNTGEGVAQRARLWSVRFDGILTVEKPDCFHKTIASGIGPAKAFGFGLLSVARA